MERLTKRGTRTKSYVSAIGSGVGCWGRIIDRLAAYENTGLEPEEILNPVEMAGVACALQKLKQYEALGAVEALTALTEPEPNPPLTLEELREMDGEPVWVVEFNDYPPRWGLVFWYQKNKRNNVYVTLSNGASICAEAFLAAGGRIYRRKPEGSTP